MKQGEKEMSNSFIFLAICVLIAALLVVGFKLAELIDKVDSLRNKLDYWQGTLIDEKLIDIDHYKLGYTHGQKDAAEDKEKHFKDRNGE